MRVVTLGLAATVFFWPAREDIITPATAQPRQDLSDFIQNAAGPCVGETSKQFQLERVEATLMARCLYTKVQRQFGEPRGFVVPNYLSRSAVFVSPRGHLIRIKDEGAMFIFGSVLYTIWCLF